MELRHLRYFLTIADELSFRKAAARLHVAQPALSVQIRQLETEIGTDLFTREDGKGIKLTDAGNEFLRHARQTLSLVSEGITKTRHAALTDVAHLSIGFVPAAEYGIFPQLIPQLRKRWPNVHLAFRDFRTLEQLQAIQANELDLGFVWLPIPTRDLDVHPLIQDSFVVVMPAGHPLEAKEEVSIADLSNEPLIFFPKSIYPDTHTSVERLFMSAGSVMNVIYELENSVSMINFVALGSGCTLLPGYARRIPHEGVTFRPLKPPNISLWLAMIKRKSRGGIADEICSFTVETISNPLGRKSQSTTSNSTSIRTRRRRRRSH
jgi:LysR family transcriptional regulator, hca operon transcriptional activator